MPTHIICPQCRLSNTVDCREEGCPGQSGFVPRTWQRPLHQIAQDLERYESLILEAADHFERIGAWGDIALRVALEAEAIRKKHAAEAPAALMERRPA